MFEYIITIILAVGLFLIYCFIKRQSIFNRIFQEILVRDRGMKDRSRRTKQYMERYSEHKTSDSSRNLIVQLLPWLCVLSLVYILGNQYVFLGTVLSGSMEPVFMRGDLVVMQTYDREPKIGDIIMVQVADKSYVLSAPVTHRVVRIESGYAITKGDANTAEDPWRVNKNNIIGKALIVAKQPITIKALGSLLVPESGEFSIMNELQKSRVITIIFQQFRVIQPFIIFFATIFYFFLLVETRIDNKKRFNNKKQNGP